MKKQNTRKMTPMYEFRNVAGHIEVYRCGSFIFSADTKAEAYAELQEIEDQQAS